jgi:uncharacterized protein (TIGR02246 family)
MNKTALTTLTLAAILSPMVAMADDNAKESQAASQTVPQTMQCASITEDEVKGLFDKWNTALATGNPNTVTARYSDDAVLLPTVSNKPRTNHAEIKDYFVSFLQKHPQGTINNRTIKLGCNMATDMGVYTFKLKEGTHTKEVQARYTFQYEFENNQWMIEHHHSSAMPEKVAAINK